MTHISPILPQVGDTNWGAPLITAINTVVDQVNVHDDLFAAGGGGGGGGGGGVTVVNNGDGTLTLTGSNVVDNGDGTFTIGS